MLFYRKVKLEKGLQMEWQVEGIFRILLICQMNLA